MKAVLISIRPKWCEQIVAGTKKLEIRKTRPILETPFKCYMYQTKVKWAFDFLRTIGFDEFAEILERGFTKVIGEFTCDYIFPITVDCNVHDELPGSPVETWLTWEDAPSEYETVQALAEAACLSYDEINRYIGRGDGCFAWHISDRKIYTHPKPLCEFYKCGALSMEDMDEEMCTYCSATDYGEKKEIHTPSGVWMCEGTWCADAYQEYMDENFAIDRPPQSWCYVEEDG